jgi:ATP-dependent helicase/DNAse subunit B
MIEIRATETNERFVRIARHHSMRLLRGAPGSGKTALVFREFAEAARAGNKDIRIVVPTATLVRHSQHELARAGLVFDPALVVSLSRFALDCAPNLKLVPARLVRALVRDALTRLPLPEFAQVAGTNGMADIILETITRFENAGCTPDRLSAIRALSDHGKAFARVWKDVDAAIAARGFATRGQVFRSAAANVPKLQVWLDGFLRFSPIEADLLRAVAANCDLTITLTDTSATHDARVLAMALGAKDNLLQASARRPQTFAFKAPSPEREADEIARRTIELQNEGVEFRDVAVAVRDVEGWLPILRSTFDRFGIPAHYYFSTPAAKHLAAGFLGGLIECALDDWDFGTTLATLRAHPAWGHSAAFDRFDFHVREAAPGRGAEALLALCDPGPLRSHIEDCVGISAWRDDRLRPAIWQRRFEQLAERLYRVRTIPEPRDFAAIESARSHTAGLRAWADALETAAHFWPAENGPVLLEQFYAVVKDALDSVGMQIPENRHNAIHVMSAFEARQWQVRTLFVCGMTARDYPRAAGPNLLFPDSDIDRLRKSGIPLRTTAEEDQDEAMLFDSLKTRASDNLILSVATHDAGGRTVVASQHFNDVPVHAPATLCAPAAVTAIGAPPVAGHIGDAVLAGLAAQHATVSLSRLEDLAKCRFRFFSGTSLRLKSRPERPDERLNYRSIGSIFHLAMEDWLADRSRDFVELFEITFDSYCHKYNIPPGYGIEVQRILSRRIAREVNASVQWPVVSSEAEVECPIHFPGGVTVKCRVDRIDDVGEGNCVIVDYKSGKVANVDSLVESETSLQGPLYALAVRENKKLNPVAMLFLAIREGKPLGWGTVPGAPFELLPMPLGWIDNARDRTIARLESFLAGDVHAEPAAAEHCVWCDFKTTCRFEQQQESLVTIGAGK